MSFFIIGVWESYYAVGTAHDHQRVSEGIRSNFFGKEALTTTIPAQFVKKFNTKIVPVYIERLENDRFKIK